MLPSVLWPTAFSGCLFQIEDHLTVWGDRFLVLLMHEQIGSAPFADEGEGVVQDVRRSTVPIVVLIDHDSPAPDVLGAIFILALDVLPVTVQRELLSPLVIYIMGPGLYRPLSERYCSTRALVPDRVSVRSVSDSLVSGRAGFATTGALNAGPPITSAPASSVPFRSTSRRVLGRWDSAVMVPLEFRLVLSAIERTPPQGINMITE